MSNTHIYSVSNEAFTDAVKDSKNIKDVFARLEIDTEISYVPKSIHLEMFEKRCKDLNLNLSHLVLDVNQ